MIREIENYSSEILQGIFPPTAFCYYNNREACTPDQVSFTVSKLNGKNGWFACDACARGTKEDRTYKRIKPRPRGILVSGELY